MKDLVSLVAAGLAKELLVENIYCGVLVRAAKVGVLIVVVKNSGANLTEIDGVANRCGLSGLTAAVYATAGTAHNFDEVKLLFAGLNCLKKLLSVSSTGNNSNSDLSVAELVGSTLDTCDTADILEIKLLKLLAENNLSSHTESSLHYTAGSTEDSACAGTDIEGSVEGLVGKIAEVDTCGLDDSAKLAGGDSNVNVGNTCCGLVGTGNLELLRGTGNSGYEEDILRIKTHLLCVVGLIHSTEHLLRRLTGRKIIGKLREVVLAVLDPSGRTRGDHGKSTAVLNAAEELGSFLNDGEVSGEIHIVYAVKAEALESCNHLALNVSTGSVVKALAESSADRGSGADSNVLGRICDSIENLLSIVLLVESAGGACNDTLTAAYAGGVSKILLECGSNVSIKATVVGADSADILEITASCYATAAKDTLAVVTNKESGGLVGSRLGHSTAKVGLLNTVLKAELLKLAGGGANAGETLLVVSGKEKFKIHTS